MKIVLINPNTGGRNRLMLPVPPYGLVSLAAVAMQGGHDVEVWDQFAYRQSHETLADMLIEHKVDLVGITCLTPAEPASRRIFDLYRLRGGKGLTLMGGVHSTVFHKKLVEQGVCDLVVRREGEGVFAELLSCLEAGRPLHDIKGITFKDKGIVVSTEDHELISNLNTLPVPAWEAITGGIDVYSQAPTLGLYGRTLPILGSRGCPKRCTFCGQEIFHKGMRFRSIDSILSEIETLHQRFAIKNFVFLDANFPISHKYGMQFCEAMIESGLHKKMGWSTELTVNIVNRELLLMMAKAGCRNIEYGFETGSQKLLDESKKGTTIEQGLEASRWTREAGIHTFGLFLIGLPGETPRDSFATLRLAMKLDCNVVKFNIVIPYPGCELFEKHRETLLENFDPESYNSWFQSSDPYRKVTVMPGGMSPNTLLFIQRIMLLIYYVRPRIVLKHLRNKTLRPRDYLDGARFLIGGMAQALWKITRSALGFGTAPDGAKDKETVAS